ncbi:CHAT domain-containing protein [Moorena producens JHB]|uniref:CHAT domain-containing protein n=1 Tax=Moorena producens (strain JHB) TaxID=1454205 RepID=A0A1D9FV82_MOOP1|nr:CHAT domain-containing protein [Moorena producens]AOY79267.1 CHAT domain-containing protein [Moorena producens JHB]
MKKLSFLIAIALTCFLPSGKALSNSVVITPNSRLPIPDSRFPIPNSRFPIPDSRFPLTDSRLPTPDSRFPIPDSRFPIPDSPDQQAQQLYETGQYQKAIPLLEQIINNYSESGDIIGQTNALVNLALVYQRLGDLEKAKQTISQSFTQLSKLPLTKESQQLKAQILSVQGQVYLSLGQAKKALSIWQETSAIYQDIGDLTRLTESQIYQVQALRILGLYNQAIKTLTQIQETIQDQPDSKLKSTALQYLGDVLRRVGKFKESQAILQQSLAIAENLPDQTLIADNLLSLGNTARLKGDTEDAIDFYQRVVKESPLADIKIQGQLNQLSIVIAKQEWSRARGLLPAIENTLRTLYPSQRAIKARIKLAKTLLKGKNSQLTTPNDLATYLADAIKLARNLGDKRAESEAIGNLGTLYEQQSRLDEAQDLTEKALLISQQVNAPDLAYQWQWQLGRILNLKQDKLKQDKKNAMFRRNRSAIAAYAQSVQTLQSIRSDLVAISSDIQFEFRESVEPVYRELVGLLLEPNASQENLKQARDVIESLQLAELDNFFRDACLDAKPVNIDEIDPNAAIFYTIILPDRLEVIATLPGQPLRQITTNLPKTEIEQQLASVQSNIASPWRGLQKQNLQTIHDWLIGPIETELAKSNILTLVFIPDGALRNLPMSVLYDGERYSIEKYNIAVAPSLQLIDSQANVRQNVSVLSAGLTEARPHRPDLGSLPGVKVELENIKGQVPSLRILLNESFTESKFNTEVNTSGYEIVHLATHGEFSSVAEDTFLLTWDDVINLNELNTLISADQKQENPIELLVLSACKTAAGDSRAALGLAGIAVRGGARSTIASLWSVNDIATTELMTRFYQRLAKGKVTKAEALRLAQQELLQSEAFEHPYYWSAFILLGNWL